MNLSNQTDLGHLIGQFGWNKGRAKALLWVWIFMLIPSLLCSLFLLGIPTLILSLYFIYRSARRLKASQPVLLIYEAGLIDNRQGIPQVIRYEEIKNIYISVKIINGVMNYILTLEIPKKTKIKIDEHIANIDQVRMALEEQFVRRKLPEAIALYQQGSPITFGSLQVDQTGLTLGKKVLPWSDFDLAEVQRLSNNVYLTIRQRDSQKVWGIQPRDIFPNLALFFTLVNYVQETQKGLVQ